MANHQTVISYYIVLILVPFVWSSNTLTANQILSISSNRTMISPGNVFELGFFKLAGSNTKEDSERWYLGLWFYKASSKMKPLWVANRETPLYDSKGALKIYKSNLVIVNQSGNIIWSSSNAVVHSPPKASSVVAEILSNGNFVLRYSDNNRGDSFLWESFDYPTDTLLPGSDSAKGVNRSLTSWISNNKPSIGIYSYALLSRNQEMFLLDAKSSPVYRRSFGLKTPYALGKGYLLQVTYDGILQQLSWSPTTREKNLIWHAPRDDCDRFGLICGSNSVCSLEKEDVHEFASCTCFKGFKPRNLWGWLLTDMTEGCQRISRLNCTGNGFQVLKNVKLPDTKDAGVERSIGPKECRQRCIEDCSCTGFANVELDCFLYSSDLLDLRTLQSGQQLYEPSALFWLSPSYGGAGRECRSHQEQLGKLVEGTDIAVKRLTRVSDSGTSQFLNEMWRNWEEESLIEVVDPSIWIHHLHR
ncbi:hypothetical protein Bca4012_031602 [Brassica carinata]